MLEKVKEVFGRHTFLSPNDLFQIALASKLRKLKKGEFLIRIGDVDLFAYTVVKGLLRSYVVTDTGDEVTLAFVPEKKNAASCESVLRGKPSVENWVALEDTWLISIDVKKMDNAAIHSKTLMRHQSTMLKETLAETIDRIQFHTVLTAEQRYEKFCGEFPKLEQRIKQKHLASYLGITPVRLSQIRAKARN